MRYITDDLVARNRVINGGWDYYAGVKGVAIYLPDKRYDPAYAGLAWSRLTAWDEFLAWSTTGSMRPPGEPAKAP
jgi:hypothetical protein